MYFSLHPCSFYWFIEIYNVQKPFKGWSKNFWQLCSVLYSNTCQGNYLFIKLYTEHCLGTAVSLCNFKDLRVFKIASGQLESFKKIIF